jgi:hypothetical protein
MIALHLASGKGKLGEGRLLVEKALQPAKDRTINICRGVTSP